MQHAKSEAAFEEAKKYIPGGVNSPVRSFRSVGGVPPIIAGGCGSKLTDIDGNEYIDYVLSYGPLLLGHAHPVVTEAIKKAAEKGSSYGAPTLAETELAKLVCRLVPSMDMVRMVNSGTEATMSELTARHLIDKGAKTIFVSNRNYDHAKELADKFNGTAIAYNKYLEQAETSDIIITSTGAPHYVIRERDMREVAAKRGGKPLILIDIAVPRDVEPSVAELPGITLYNIDDLEGVVDTNKHFRTHEAQVAEAIIEEEIAELKERLRYLTMRPVMVQLHEKMNFLREKVLKRAFAKMPELTDHERRIIDIMTQRLEHKFLREPMTAMNAAAGTPDEERLRKMICELFLLNDKGEDYIDDENKFDYWD